MITFCTTIQVAACFIIHRHHKADDEVHYMSPDDSISFDSTFSKGTSTSKDTTSTKATTGSCTYVVYLLHASKCLYSIGFANPLYAEPDEQPDEQPDEEHLYLDIQPPSDGSTL